MQTKTFLKGMSINLTTDHILQIYMVMGGVPYYLTKITPGLSAAQIIEQIAFKKNSFLLEEFDNLYSSLFNDAEASIKIVRTISHSRYGIGQRELLKKLGKNLQGKGGIEKLKELQDTSFIMSFKPLFHKQRGIYL